MSVLYSSPSVPEAGKGTSRTVTSVIETGSKSLICYNLIRYNMRKMFAAASAILCLFVGVSVTHGQENGKSVSIQSGPKVASQVEHPAGTAKEHPLMPVIRWAEREKPRIEAIQDYTAIMTKQENIGGEVQEAQVMEIKVRHQPLSFYVKFKYPKKMIGQEAIWVHGRNEGKLVGHGVGFERNFGTQFLDPEGMIAMRGCKYSMKEMGILNLINKLLDVGYKDSKYGECEVKYYEKDIKIGDRECTLIRVIHPVPRKNFIFHIAQIFVDKELNVPIRYDSYEWPRAEGEQPVLLEAYTFQQLKLNVGLTDKDFDHKNPEYDYP